MGVYKRLEKKYSARAK